MDEKHFIKKICLGTAQFGSDYGIANVSGKIGEAQAREILDYARASGIDCIDTASAYGDSEATIGRWLRSKGPAFKIISKLSKIDLLSPEAVEKELTDTLKALGQRSIYGYFIHSFEEVQRYPQLWKILKDAKRNGLIQKLGFSLYHPADLAWLVEQGIDFDILQVPLSVFDQRFGDYFSSLKDKNIEIDVRSVFLQGLAFLEVEALPEKLRKAAPVLSRLRKISADNRIPIEALCLNAVLLNPWIDRVVIGVDGIDQLKENITNLKYLGQTQSLREALASLRIEDEDILLPYRWSFV